MEGKAEGKFSNVRIEVISQMLSVDEEFKDACEVNINLIINVNYHL